MNGFKLLCLLFRLHPTQKQTRLLRQRLTIPNRAIISIICLEHAIDFREKTAFLYYKGLRKSDVSNFEYLVSS